MNIDITSAHAVEILDSRGRRTLAKGPCRSLTGACPVRAARGSGVTVLLRDDAPPGTAPGASGQRTAGSGRQRQQTICDALTSPTFADLTELDHSLIDVDGTPNKHRLGANAIVGSRWQQPAVQALIDGVRSATCGAGSGARHDRLRPSPCIGVCCTNHPSLRVAESPRGLDSVGGVTL